MTQPVNSSYLNYTPYDPDRESCRTEGGNSTPANGGAEGTGNTSTAPQARQSDDCRGELLAATATCGSLVLLARTLPAVGLGLIGCAGALIQLNECRAETETKAQGQ